MTKRERPQIFSDYDLPDDPGIDCSVEPSMTQQNFRDECDINNIMARYETTGLIEFRNDCDSGRYVDLASAVDFQSAQNMVIEATNAFLSIPPDIRAKFDNDPAKFLSFVEDPKNAQALIDLGLATPHALEASQASVASSTVVPAAPDGAGQPQSP